MMIRTVPVVLFAISAGLAFAEGDAEAGGAIFESKCGSCHYEDDFSGKSAQEVLAQINEQAAPGAKHMFKLSRLTEQEMADIAAFFDSKGD